MRAFDFGVLVWDGQTAFVMHDASFGDAIKRANDTGEKSSKRGPSNMLMQLPDEFTYQQVIDLRVANGMSQKGTSKMLGNWKDRHYIRAKENDSVPQFLSSSVFIKLKFRKENS